MLLVLTPIPKSLAPAHELLPITQLDEGLLQAILASLGVLMRSVPLCPARVLLMIHEGLVVELIFNELLMVLCVGETSVGNRVHDLNTNW